MPVEGFDAGYSWELRHDNRIVEYGTLAWSDQHPWTGKAATDPYEMGSELFDLACSLVLEESRDAVVDARMEGRPEPTPIDVLTLILREPDGRELVSMTARLIHLPITEEYVQEQIALLRASEEEDRRLALARRQRAEEPDPYPLLADFLAPQPLPQPEPAEPPDPHRQRIDDLERRADDLRESVVDPDHCRRRLFEAELRLTEAEQEHRHLAADADDGAREDAAAHIAHCAERVTFWHTRATEATETFLRAAALDAEAARLRRAEPER
ncbi:hypothetical protein NDR87_02900 [Nocardia sp. CDC159]|uniref:Uncharacterized protein n=1 Tax=Nocardia pulmonis TaxID=2951408 RepID=A0A9X2E1C2_9NOCA|nr:MULTISPECIES: hypothetical protein [Nocardia]MCM6772039.1 hypothetical protein [Nocardia pulmonis]MCM6785303.1 hypothetical protein [Nocardia sp. CDC159]